MQEDMQLVIEGRVVVVFPCGNSFPAILGIFACFSEYREKSAKKSGKRKHAGTH
jgi:hypothetical protein